MFADQSLEHRALKDVIEKTLKSVIKRELANYSVSQFAMGARQVCRTLVCRTSIALMAFLVSKGHRNHL